MWLIGTFEPPLYVAIKMNVSLGSINDTIEILKVSTNTKLEKLHDEMYGSLGSKIGYYILLIISHIIAPVLLAGMIAYEKRGGDPQKRNIINRLQSIGIINQILFTLIVGLVRVWREVFGLIDLDVMIWIDWFACILLYNLIITFDEMTIIQFFYIVVWKRVKRIDDEFWACSISVMTTGVSIWLSFAVHIDESLQLRRLKIHTSNLTQEFEELRYIELIEHF